MVTLLDLIPRKSVGIISSTKGIERGIERLVKVTVISSVKLRSLMIGRVSRTNSDYGRGQKGRDNGEWRKIQNSINTIKGGGELTVKQLNVKL